MEHIILGVDPGTQILGYSILSIEDAKPRLVIMDVLYLKRIPEYNLRIRKIFDSMVEIIDKYHPDHLAIEAPFFGKNVQSMLKLGRAQGVTIAAAMSRDLSFTEYEPATIKQTVAGNGNASKDQVRQLLAAQMNIDINPKYLDASDALAAAYTGYRMLYNPKAEIQQLLKPVKKKKTSSRQAWSQFVTSNPDKVK